MRFKADSKLRYLWFHVVSTLTRELSRSWVRVGQSAGSPRGQPAWGAGPPPHIGRQSRKPAFCMLLRFLGSDVGLCVAKHLLQPAYIAAHMQAIHQRVM